MTSVFKLLRKFALPLSLLLAVGLLVYQFSAEFPKPSNTFSPTGEPSTSITVPKNLAGFYSQKPLWKDCEGSNTNARCGSIKVPLNWANPAAGSIEIAVAINPASDPKTAPYLLMNPGGPGGSGRTFITEYIDGTGTPALRAKYNLVGFDPRGVGGSSAIKCYSTEKMKTFLYSSSPYELGSTDDMDWTKKLVKDFGAACARNTGALLGHVDTSSAAKDMDIIRAVLGSKKLNYLGYSYGSLLGLTYSTYFPDKVGKFVLDGIVDPSVTPSEDSLNQLKGFQSAMKAYLADCIKSNAKCPFKGLTVDQAMSKVGKDFLGVLEKGSYPTTENGRELNLTSGFTGMISGLYSKDSWQYISLGFTDFFNPKKRDGRIFLLLADNYFQYDDSSNSFSGNENESFRAINCLDSRESSKLSDILAQNKKVLAVSPVLGRYWQYGGLSCSGWPYAVVPGPKDYSAKGAPTMLIVGTTNDPATPYFQATNVAHNILDKARLLTYTGEGHTAYVTAGNTCVDKTVDEFFINGNLPSKDKICK